MTDLLNLRAHGLTFPVDSELLFLKKHDSCLDLFDGVLKLLLLLLKMCSKCESKKWVK